MWGDMKSDIPSISNLQLVSEDMVEWCAKQCADDEDNTFSRFLAVAAEFREAGLTPIFLCSETLRDMYVTTRERLQKKLH